MYRTVAGIDMLEPGYKRIRIPSLRFASATFDSPYGMISPVWERKDNKIIVR